MSEQIEPTPEVSGAQPRAAEGSGQETPARAPGSAEAELTTASLARAAETGEPAGEQPRSFADAEAGDGEGPAPLFAGDETAQLRSQWDAIQASFVDEPRRAVEEADRLVASAINRLAEMFAQEKGRLEGQWDRGGEVSTEDLRQALRRYRSFFGRVLSV
jgi:hypothetical protein